MAKFKIGDKVILKSNIVLDKEYNNVFLSNCIYKDLKNKIKIDGFLTIDAYGSYETVVHVIANKLKWFVGEDALELYQEQPHTYKVGDIVSICGIVGKIRPSSVNYYLNFEDILDQEHLPCCKKVRELVPNFDKIANKFGTVCNTSKLFPEFETIDELMQFVQAINTEYNSKQLTILKKSETYEIRFQKSKASSKRGVVPKGSTICGRKDKIAISIGHLSYQVCNC